MRCIHQRDARCSYLQDGQCKRSSLTRAGLRQTNDVASLECVRKCLLLNHCGMHVSHCLACLRALDRVCTGRDTSAKGAQRPSCSNVILRDSVTRIRVRWRTICQGRSKASLERPPVCRRDPARCEKAVVRAECTNSVIVFGHLGLHGAVVDAVREAGGRSSSVVGSAFSHLCGSHALLSRASSYPAIDAQVQGHLTV